MLVFFYISIPIYHPLLFIFTNHTRVLDFSGCKSTDLHMGFRTFSFILMPTKPMIQIQIY